MGQPLTLTDITDWPQYFLAEALLWCHSPDSAVPVAFAIKLPAIGGLDTFYGLQVFKTYFFACPWVPAHHACS